MKGTELTPRLDKRKLIELEQALGKNLTGVASELRLVDIADFVAFTRTGQTPNLQNIVQSSTELHFKPGTLGLAGPAEAEIKWNGLPLVTLPMQFRYAAILAYFKLRLAAESASVELEALSAELPFNGFNDLSRYLTVALDQARIHAQQTSFKPYNVTSWGKQ